MVILRNVGLRRVLLIMMVLFIVGCGFSYYTNPSAFFVVTGPDSYGGTGIERSANEFIVDGCGADTMLDTVTGLCWDKNWNRLGSGASVAAGNAHCSGLALGGHNDWRMPEVAEFFSVLDQVGNGGFTTTALTNIGFTNVQNAYYWTATPRTGFPTSQWQIAISYNGLFQSNTNTGSYYIVCVRTDRS